MQMYGQKVVCRNLLLQTNIGGWRLFQAYLGTRFLCISGCFACAKTQIPISLSRDLRTWPTGQEIIRDYLNTRFSIRKANWEVEYVRTGWIKSEDLNDLQQIQLLTCSLSHHIWTNSWTAEHLKQPALPEIAIYSRKRRKDQWLNNHNLNSLCTFDDWLSF